jgi:hypothetical protein
LPSTWNEKESYQDGCEEQNEFNGLEDQVDSWELKGAASGASKPTLMSSRILQFELTQSVAAQTVGFPQIWHAQGISVDTLRGYVSAGCSCQPNPE